ncbi:MAG: hypothetical protein FWB79_02180 [Treponema sp.]|nr:hypothetical protein [Treponema sp.]
MIEKGRLGLLLAGFAMLAALAMTGCPNGNVPDPEEPGTTIPEDPDTVTPGETATLPIVLDFGPGTLAPWTDAVNSTSSGAAENDTNVTVGHVTLFGTVIPIRWASEVANSNLDGEVAASPGRIQTTGATTERFIEIGHTTDATLTGPLAVVVQFTHTGEALTAGRGIGIGFNGETRVTNPEPEISGLVTYEFTRFFMENEPVTVQIGSRPGGGIRIVNLEVREMTESELNPVAQSVTLSGMTNAEANQEITITATVLPIHLGNRNVTWAIDPPSAEVANSATDTVSGGTIRVARPDAGSITVIATAVALGTDGGAVSSAAHVVEVTAEINWGEPIVWRFNVETALAATPPLPETSTGNGGTHALNHDADFGNGLTVISTSNGGGAREIRGGHAANFEDFGSIAGVIQLTGGSASDIRILRISDVEGPFLLELAYTATGNNPAAPVLRVGPAGSDTFTFAPPSGGTGNDHAVVSELLGIGTGDDIYLLRGAAHSRIYQVRLFQPAP